MPPFRSPMLARSATVESSEGRNSGAAASATTIPGHFAGRNHGVPQVVRAHRPSHPTTQGNQLRPREGGHIDDHVRALLARLDQSVGQHEPSFGIGVQHLHRLAAADGDHVAGPLRRAARHVLGQRQPTGHSDGQSQPLGRLHHCQHAGGAPMSLFMVSMALAGLRESPPESKVIPLPTGPPGSWPGPGHR